MDIREERRKAAVERMASFVLTEGLAAGTLRPLAAAAGTSDRMLLYYFKNRDDILSAILHFYADRLIVQLDEAIPAGELRPFQQLLNEVTQLLASDSVRPSMHLWLELAASAARGLEPHRSVAKEIADQFLNWTASRLAIREDASTLPAAALFVVLIEGLHVLEAVGRADAGRAALAEVSVLLSDR